MKKLSFIVTTLFFLFSFFPSSAQKWFKSKHKKTETKKEKEWYKKNKNEGAKYDDWEGALRFEFNMTKNPTTGKIPAGSFDKEKAQANEVRKQQANNFTNAVGNYSFQGPDNLGGRTRSIVYDVRYNGTSNRIIMAGGISSGVYKSIDDGATWVRKSPTGDHFSCTSLAQDPRPGFQDTWYYAVGESLGNSANATGALYLGNGVYKSTDNGETWARLPGSNAGILENFDNPADLISKVIVDPTNGNIYVAALATILRSTDGGTTWGTVLNGSFGSTEQLTDIAVTSTGRFYAAFAGANAAGSDGVWTSTTGAAGSFTRIAGGGTPATWNANGTYGRVVLAIAPNLESTVYVLYDKSTVSSCAGTPAPEAKLFRYDLAGPSWADLSATLPDEPGCDNGNDPFAIQGGYDLVVSVKPDAAGTIFIGGTNAYRSTDAGATWTRIGGYANATGAAQYINSHADIHFFAFQPGTATTMLCGNDGGIQRTTANLAATVAWTPINAGFRSYQYVAVDLDPRTGNGRVIGGAQDNGTTRNSGGSGINFEEIFSGDGVSVGISGASDLEYLGFQNGGIQRKNYTDPSGVGTDIKPTGSGAGLFVTLFKLDQDNTERLYYASDNNLWRTTSASTVVPGTWTALTGIGTAVGAANKISSIGLTRGTYNAATASLFIGTDNAKLFRLDNPTGVAAATAPVDISGGAFPAGGYISSIAANPRNDDTLLITFSNYGVASAFWTGNANAATPTWTAVEGNIPLPSYRSSSIIVTSGAVQYLVGTSVGLFSVSGLPAGGSPTWIQEGPAEMGNAIISALALRPADNKLLVGTHGYGMWFTTVAAASASTDYFRSITSGNWNLPATWESSSSSNFAAVISPATLSPDVSSNKIDIRNGHTVTVTANVTADQTFVNPGATLIVTGSTLTVNGPSGLTVQSSAAGTGIIGNSTGTIAGNVTVERYINSDVVGRKWHLLSGIATTTAQTIRASWQEGGGAPATPNMGTWITDAGTPPGFDGPSISSSLLKHDPTGPAWLSVAATNAGSINADRAYMLFVRGDRFANPGNALQAQTVLRTTGTLNQGTQTAVTVLSASPGYTILGNPFASPIDLENVLTTSNLGQFFYVWDASIPGNFNVGGFRLVQKTGPGVYTATPSSANNNSLRYIHSGQGFFLKASVADASVVLNENHKTNMLSVINPIVNTAGSQQVYTELMVADPGAVEYVADAVRVWYNNSFSSGTKDDILKMGNFSENISSYRGDKKWIIENRPMIVKKDTIFLRTSGTGIHNYRLRINTQDFIQTNVTAFLQDTWLNTSKPLSLDGSVTNIDFSVTADPASANQDRFRIVFAAVPLPAAFTTIKATQQNNAVAVEWKVTNQLTIAKYELEKSADGINFSKVNTQTASSITDATYNWLDVTPAFGNNYYRIRSIGMGGEVKISQVVHVIFGKGSGPSITVYPSPVVNKAMNVLFTNMEKGNYQLRLININGAMLFTRQFTHNGGNAVLPVPLSRSIAAGTYQLEIINPDKSRSVRSVVISN